ncbi:hypothetical protein [Thermospira aquatica]|uniref:Uncharacterized protein n=1 Tax=Thermospira aquatica TaxID=2828656 RepID=A0AAX3BBI6_9SPIR|nr:hypothetical protein [Thermospira aquatica]URA09575.1 hypothetical protein KDW03_08775 [Thermospira aquatica]
MRKIYLSLVLLLVSSWVFGGVVFQVYGDWTTLAMEKVNEDITNAESKKVDSGWIVGGSVGIEVIKGLSLGGKIEYLSAFH